MATTSLLDNESLAHGRAGLPTPASTASYWHRDPSAKLIGQRTSSKLPLSADVVVIGSGITSAFAAQELVKAGRSVVMLEAREACWGATGRNGGHCQPGIWDSPPEIGRFELETFHQLQQLIQKNDIACDWRVVGGVHAVYSPEVLDAVKNQIQRLQQYPDLRDKAILIEDKDQLEAKCVPEALAAVYQPLAAQLWPYKLVAWLLERLLSNHSVEAFNLQTKTPVTRIEHYKEGEEFLWRLCTQRGQMRAKDVLLATNAYTSHLVPDMAGLITPVRAQVCALEPPPGATQLMHSYVWMKGADHQYLIQRDSEDRYLIFGGERPTAGGRDEGVSSDDEVDPAVSRALETYIHHGLELSSNNNISNKSKKPPALRAAYEWTGIMGFSSDGGPWVGRVPDSLLKDQVSPDGLWISAGYTGHGMPVAARCGVAVAQMMLGRQDGVQIPKQWMATESRVQTARSAVLPRTLHEHTSQLPAENQL